MNKNTPKQELVLDKTYNQQNLEIYLPECIILVGLSGCGKSTFAKKLQGTELDKNKKAYSILNGDEIREELTGDINNQEHNEEVFKLLHRRIKDNLKAKNSIIIDATNLKLKNRRSYLNCIKKIPCVKKIYIFAVPREICEENQNKRQRKVPKEIIKRQEMSFEIPFFEEGYDEIHIVDMQGKDLIDETIKPIDTVKSTEFYKKQIGFNQRTKHHLYTLDEHSDRVAKAVEKYNLPYHLVQLVSCNINLTEKEVFDSFAYSKTMLKEVAYVHDYGKLFVGIPKDDGSGDYKYFNHHNVSSYEILCNIRDFGLKDINFVIDFLFYINYHMLLFFINTSKAEKKWRNIFGDWKYEMLTIFNECDIIGSGTRKERVGVN